MHAECRLTSRRRRRASGVVAAGDLVPDRARQPAARSRRPRLGDRRRDRQGRAGLHPRQRRRGRPPARRRGAGARAISLDEEATDVAEPDATATCAATAPPAPGSSARSRPRRRSTRCACSAPGSPARGKMLLAGLRWAVEQGYDVDQHEPLDDEAAVHERAARARRHRLLQAHGARRLGAQHAGRDRSRGGSPR